jgi:hypothetical protein
MYAIGYPLFSIATLLDYLLLIYSFIIIAVVILSWTNRWYAFCATSPSRLWRERVGMCHWWAGSI